VLLLHKHVPSRAMTALQGPKAAGTPVGAAGASAGTTTACKCCWCWRGGVCCTLRPEGLGVASMPGCGSAQTHQGRPRMVLVAVLLLWDAFGEAARAGGWVGYTTFECDCGSQLGPLGRTLELCGNSCSTTGCPASVSSWGLFTLN
jgi:hypothetical protein